MNLTARAAVLLIACALPVACLGDIDPSGPASAVASIAVGPDEITLIPGARRTLTAVATDASGNPLPTRSVTWSSSHEAIATVDAAGVVTGVAPGTATITATTDGHIGTGVVTVEHALTRIVFSNVPARVETIHVTLTAPTGAGVSVSAAASEGAVADVPSGRYTVSLSATAVISGQYWAFRSPVDTVVVNTGQQVTVNAGGLTIATVALRVTVSGLPGDADVTCGMRQLDTGDGREFFLAFPREMAGLAPGNVQFRCEPVTIGGRTYEPVEQVFSVNVPLNGATPFDFTLMYHQVAGIHPFAHPGQARYP